MPSNAAEVVIVEDPASGLLHEAGRGQVASVPRGCRGAGGWVVATACAAQFAAGGCAQGSRCGRAHLRVPVQQLPRTAAHVHFTWAAPHAVQYPVLAAAAEAVAGLAGGALACVPVVVLGPNRSGTSQTIPAGLLLHTRGALASVLHPGGPSATSHCAHYYYNCVCMRGADCAFAHMVSVGAVAGGAARGPTARYRHHTAGLRPVPDLAMPPLPAYAQVEPETAAVAAAGEVCVAEATETDSEDACETASVAATEGSEGPALEDEHIGEDDGAVCGAAGTHCGRSKWLPLGGLNAAFLAALGVEIDSLLLSQPICGLQHREKKQQDEEEDEDEEEEWQAPVAAARYYRHDPYA